MDVFAWSHKDMSGIAPERIMHSLKIDPSFPPIHQMQMRFASERDKSINDEVDRLFRDMGYRRMFLSSLVM